MSDFRALAEKTVVELFDMVKEKVAEIEQLKKERNDLQKRVNGVSQVLCELKESMDGFKEMDLYDKGYRVTTEYVIADLEQALRGEHENSN